MLEMCEGMDSAGLRIVVFILLLLLLLLLLLACFEKRYVCGFGGRDDCVSEEMQSFLNLSSGAEALKNSIGHWGSRPVEHQRDLIWALIQSVRNGSR